MSPSIFLTFTSILTFAVPLAVSFFLFKTKSADKRDWSVRVLFSSSVILFFYILAPWGFLPYYLRYLFFLLMILGVIKSYANIGGEVPRGKKSIIVMLFFTSLFLIPSYLAVKGRSFKDTPAELSFPLKGGTFYVLQGGNSFFTNPFHSGNPMERLAVDIVKLHRTGNRAKGFFPEELSSYAIYGEPLFSPCEGIVLKAVGGVQDNRPGVMDKENPEGNYVKLKCGEVVIFMAHQMKGSVRLKEGDKVKVGELIGNVGNSGNTIEPHLHIQANTPGGEALPILFEKRFLVLNDIFVN